MNPHPRILHFTRTVRLPALCIAAVVSSIAAATFAADDGIIVRGVGSASGRPTQIEMSATLSGEAALAADALVKFHDAKKRALAAIAGLKNPDLAVEPGGVSVGSGTDANTQMMIMRGMTPPNNPQNIRITETSRIVLTHTEKLEPDELLEKVLKILDVAKDSGYQIGPAPATNWYEMQQRAQEGGAGEATVSFKLPDSTALREKAYKAAIDDAKNKAKRLADLSGAKLGRILSVHDEGVNKSEPGAMIMYFYGSLSNKGGAEDKAIAGSTSGDLTLHVNLQVQFEIANEPSSRMKATSGATTSSEKP
jgi:uncharacterized protein YggE